MNETYALNHPVETLLCGPAASVMGGAYLGHYPKSVIIDMGGTTSDIALVKDHLPVRADNGIQIGSCMLERTAFRNPSMTGSRRAFKSALAPRWMTLRSWNR